MALLDFLKNKKQNEKSQQPAKKADKVLAAKKSSVKNATPKQQSVKKESVVANKKPAQTSAVKTNVKHGFSYETVKQPHISEKASFLAEKNQYVFQVAERSNKKEIKKSVEGIYGVNVLSVNIIKIPPKKRRLGKTEGFKKSYVKAIVKIREDQKIEIL